MPYLDKTKRDVWQRSLTVYAKVGIEIATTAFLRAFSTRQQAAGNYWRSRMVIMVPAIFGDQGLHILRRKCFKEQRHAWHDKALFILTHWIFGTSHENHLSRHALAMLILSRFSLSTISTNTSPPIRADIRRISRTRTRSVSWEG